MGYVAVFLPLFHPHQLLFLATKGHAEVGRLIFPLVIHSFQVARTTFIKLSFVPNIMAEI